MSNKRRLKSFFDLIGMAEKEAIEFIQKNEPPEGYFLGFSGGKDSCVLKYLTEKSSVRFQSYYSATRIDPPELVKFIKAYHKDVIWKFPKRSFFSFLIQYGYPSCQARWCCSSLKKQPTSKVLLKHRLLGIRAEESVNRSKFGRIASGGNSPYVKGQIVYKPIFYWSEWMVWNYIENNDIPYCSLYDDGVSRIGCMVCPMICKPDMILINQNKKRWPGFYKAFEKAMSRLYLTHKHLDGVRSIFTFDEFLERWYKGQPILKIANDKIANDKMINNFFK